MPTVADTRFPTLSQISHWDVGHLEQAASNWTTSANHWEAHFETLHRQAMSPGGEVWEGRVADAAQHRTYADLLEVRSAADDLRSAAVAARRGADKLQYARSSVLKAIAAAEKAGLVVGEDLSVTVALTSGSASEQSRQLAIARQRADEIAARVIELSAVDKRIADAITTATAPEVPSIVPPPAVSLPPTLPSPIEVPQMRGGLAGGVMPNGTLPYLVHPPEAGDPLLWKGDDFTHTGIASALSQ